MAQYIIQLQNKIGPETRFVYSVGTLKNNLTLSFQKVWFGEFGLQKS